MTTMLVKSNSKCIFIDNDTPLDNLRVSLSFNQHGIMLKNLPISNNMQFPCIDLQLTVISRTIY